MKQEIQINNQLVTIYENETRIVINHSAPNQAHRFIFPFNIMKQPSAIINLKPAPEYYWLMNLRNDIFSLKGKQLQFYF